jgi:hypothetical protein
MSHVTLALFCIGCSDDQDNRIHPPRRFQRFQRMNKHRFPAELQVLLALSRPHPGSGACSDDYRA